MIRMLFVWTGTDQLDQTVRHHVFNRFYHQPRHLRVPHSVPVDVRPHHPYHQRVDHIHQPADEGGIQAHLFKEDDFYAGEFFARSQAGASLPLS